ncbi:acetyltransferase [Thalassotalea agarivorans]|uniref:PglD N-terminal domain-containing protein n=1 Tax=Thalassotalea agarivorans TaxID=349064 RepID=A0A1H9Y217_THASX|nr:acetyltransferase [Thalassotalea agarivorans]SES62748.1 hypothetical protein SAMN05660429_00029 [Thalassotalea agarivorans]
MTTKCIGIYGASGFGKEVLPLVRQLIHKDKSKIEIVFIDDNESVQKLSGLAVLPYQVFKEKYEEKSVVIAIANSQVREKIAAKLEGDGISQLAVCADNNIIMDDVEIDQGSLLCPFVTLTSNIKIGKSFHANIYSYVAHDCVIGDYVTFAPRVMCNGNIHIEDHAYIGTGAIIKQGTPDKPLVIGSGAIVGMGAVVTKDVPPNTVVVGNPAKPLKK